MVERSHLSIGEVLSLLREEFPDVTISKIRFLESQGLVDPERTPSGYRKFYDHDVERLRWILRQQRENFLPLKVIRGRLTEGGDPDLFAQNGGDATAPGADDEDAPIPETAATEAPAVGAAEPVAGAELATSAGLSAISGDAGEAGDPERPERPERPDDEGLAAAGPPRSAAPAIRPTTVTGGTRTTAAAAAAPVLAAPTPAPAPAAPLAPPRPAATRTGSERRRPPTAQAAGADDTESFSAEELARAAGAAPVLIAELQDYGLIRPHAVVAGTPYFDEAALAVSRAAAGFAAHGVEARHLRSWRNAADREAGLFEQVVIPLLRQRNPEARRQALDTLAELARLGGELRAALIERAVREIR